MVSGNYRNAIQYYEALEARFPFSNEAKQAQLDLIYCYYKNGEIESAIDASQPVRAREPDAPARGLRALHARARDFRRAEQLVLPLLRVDLAKRPPDRARESFSAFSQLLQRYPDSPYAADARQRMVFLRNRLAEHENHVAHYYFERGAYLAALNRASSPWRATTARRPSPSRCAS